MTYLNKKIFFAICLIFFASFAVKVFADSSTVTWDSGDMSGSPPTSVGSGLLFVTSGQQAYWVQEYFSGNGAGSGDITQGQVTICFTGNAPMRCYTDSTSNGAGGSISLSSSHSFFDGDYSDFDSASAQFQTYNGQGPCCGNVGITHATFALFGRLTSATLSPLQPSNPGVGGSFSTDWDTEWSPSSGFPAITVTGPATCNIANGQVGSSGTLNCTVTGAGTVNVNLTAKGPAQSGGAKVISIDRPLNNPPSSPPGNFSISGGCYGWPTPSSDAGLSSLSSGADSYDLQRQINGGSWVTVKSGNAGNGLGAVNYSESSSAGSVYTWRVNAINSSGVTPSNTIGYTVNAGNCGGSQASPPPPVLGCTDPGATNYNPSANQNDGSCTYASTNQPPSMVSATISPNPITANGSNTYTITETTTDPNGGADIKAQFVMINQTGANAGKYRGYVGWTRGGDWGSYFWTLGVAGPVRSCTVSGDSFGGYGGVSAQTQFSFQSPAYTSPYINVLSCSTAVSGTTRTNTWIVSFNPIFATDGPQSNNQISAFTADTPNTNNGWTAFGTFDLVGANVGPVPTGATIASSTVRADGSTVHTITLTATDANGGDDIYTQYGIINFQGPQSTNYRGYIAWYKNGDFTNPLYPWAGSGGAAPGSSVTCSDGTSKAAKSNNSTYGTSYINVVGCTSTVSGNTRTTTINVTFDPSFTTPTSGNTISGWVADTAGLAAGWNPFGTFKLVPTVTTSAVLTDASGNPVSTIAQDGSTPYLIKVIGTDTDGVSGLENLDWIINYQGSNAGSYRGAGKWKINSSYYTSAPFNGSSYKNSMTCTGGGSAVLWTSIWGTSYINLISCTKSDSGNQRTITYRVTFDPSYTTPTSQNDISSSAVDSPTNTYAVGATNGWLNNDLNFGLTGLPAVTFSASPTSVTSGGSSTLTWTVSGSVTSCTASGGWSGAKSTSGGSQSTGALVATQTYNLSCTGPGGTTVANPVAVTVTGSATKNVTLTVNPGPGGYVTSAPSGINTTTCSSPCVASFPTNSTVTLTPTPASSYWKFTGWVGDCTGLGLCVLNLSADRVVQATFGKRTFNYSEF